MSRPRSLPDAEAIAAEQWFRDYERVGTFQAKCRELHVTSHTLRDAIRRVRGLDTRVLTRKLSEAEKLELIELIHVDLTVKRE
jgi:hypothetical protein